MYNLVLTTLLLFSQTVFCDNNTSAFNPKFSFGVGTSAYQIEGAWNVSGRTIGLYDYVAHSTPNILDGSNGDIACDSYHKVDEDIRILKNLGVNHYRFSISWTRILPTGYRNKVNPEGVAYYNELIDKLIANHIEPWVTMYHFDYPYSTEVIGGWLQEQTALQLAEYSDLLFQLFGDRVKVWTSINEPFDICVHLLSFLKIGRPLGISEYICGRNILRGHALVADIYNRKYRDKQKGKLGIAFNIPALLPASSSAKDKAATEKVINLVWGWFVYPVIFGDYPPLMIKEIARYSTAQGFISSRLPPFSSKEKNMLKNSIDFIGLNHFEIWLVEANGTIDPNQSWENDLGANIIKETGWNSTTYNKMRAKEFGVILKYLDYVSGGMDIRIMEQGTPDKHEVINDTERHTYLILCLKTILRSISEGVNVTGYTLWSLMDNFEWNWGYKWKYGLYHVNFSDDARTRTPKFSANTYKQIIKQRSISGIEEIYSR